MWLRLPAVPVTVNVKSPKPPAAEVLTVRAVLPVGVTGFVVKEEVAPEGSPDTLRETGWPDPAVVVTFTV